MTFGRQICAVSTGASHTAMAAMRLNRSLLPDGRNVNENGVAVCSGDLSGSPESISVGNVLLAVVISSDKAKQTADALPEARYAFREWRRKEVS